MDTNLLLIRVKSFAWSAGTLIAGALLTALASSDFATLIAEHFGTGVAGTLVSLLVVELVKHGRNLLEARKVGSFKPKLYI